MPRNQIPAELRRLVIERAHHCCEYCLLHQADALLAHHVDHVRPRKHKGKTILSNLALSCAFCNLHKGTDFAAYVSDGDDDDDDDEQSVFLFNPRRQVWAEHFSFNGAFIVGITPRGIATVKTLQFNLPDRLLQREKLMNAGVYPSSQFLLP